MDTASLWIQTTSTTALFFLFRFKLIQICTAITSVCAPSIAMPPLLKDNSLPAKHYLLTSYPYLSYPDPPPPPPLQDGLLQDGLLPMQGGLLFPPPPPPWLKRPPRPPRRPPPPPPPPFPQGISQTSLFFFTRFCRGTLNLQFDRRSKKKKKDLNWDRLAILFRNLSALLSRDLVQY